VSEPVAVVLAAGKSTRMKSDTPKVLHEIWGQMMIDYVLDAARQSGVRKIIVVVGHQAERVQQALSHHSDVEFALQAEQHGTGHAVMVCREQLTDHNGPVLILAGDTPLLKSRSLQGLLTALRDQAAACVIGTAETAANEGLGRVVRNEAGEFLRIVEHKDASPEELLIQEINTGCYAFDCQALLHSLGLIKPENKQAEYYLTDCPRVLLDEGAKVFAACELSIDEAMGVNTRLQLAEIRQRLQMESLTGLMQQGVTILNPEQVSIAPRVEIGRDTIIHPFTVIDGGARIGSGCEIGPYVHIKADTIIPAAAVIRAQIQHQSAD